jgi:thioesterase domain-containing protein
MAQTAAHLVDHVIPQVPVRQWVISVPKRLRCFLANRPEAVAALTKIFLAEIERLLSAAAAVTSTPRATSTTSLVSARSVRRTTGIKSARTRELAMVVMADDDTRNAIPDKSPYEEC